MYVYEFACSHVGGPTYVHMYLHVLMSVHVKA